MRNINDTLCWLQVHATSGSLDKLKDIYAKLSISEKWKLLKVKNHVILRKAAEYGRLNIFQFLFDEYLGFIKMGEVVKYS